MPRRRPRKVSPAKANEELSRAIIALLLKESFYGHVLGGVARAVTERTPTAAVAGIQGGAMVELLVNPNFFVNELNKKERVAVLKHECLHLVFHHVFRFDRQRHHPLLHNLAADLVVNQFIKPWPLPDSAITLETFPDLGLKKDQTLDWYYKRLLGLAKELYGPDLSNSSNSGQGGAGQSGPSGSNQGQGQQGQSGQGQQGQGQSGQGQQGQGQQGQGQQGEGDEKGEKGTGADPSSTSAPKSAEVLDRMFGGNATWHSDHAGWGNSNEQLGDASLDRLIANASARSMKDWGSLPAGVRQAIEGAIRRRKPQVDWRRTLRLFSASSRRTRIASTVRRKSRRFGTIPGIKIKRFQRMLVALDTSGSIQHDELEVFFAEIYGMWRQGAEVTIVECDAQVQRVYPYRGRLPDDIKGRGGTAFDPVFKWMHENRHQRFDGVIYLTDGYAATPQIRPPCRVLWVVSHRGSDKALTWGQKVTLKP